MLNRLVRQLGALKYLFADNGGEFAGRLVDLEAYHHGVRIDFSRPGKPTDNAYIETSYGSFRDECLNLHWFAAIGEARRVIEAWRREYNESRPHMALGNPLRTPISAGQLRANSCHYGAEFQCSEADIVRATHSGANCARRDTASVGRFPGIVASSHDIAAVWHRSAGRP
jgi:hypothetical protein